MIAVTIGRAAGVTTVAMTVAIRGAEEDAGSSVRSAAATGASAAAAVIATAMRGRANCRNRRKASG